MKPIFCSLALAAAAMLCSCQQPAQTAVSAAAPDSAALGIAFVNTDSILISYDYAKKVDDILNGKAETSRADLNQKAKAFQQEIADFQRKVQYNGFQSVERAQSEQQRLQKKEAELQELNQKLSAELMQEQARFSAELRDTLVRFLNSYAKDRYSLILSNNMGDNVLYSAPGVDITKEVVEQLNARYAASQQK